MTIATAIGAIHATPRRMGIPWASHHEGDHLGGIDSGKGRENRPGDARAQLRLAHDQFASIGMEAFAERARRGLAASGEAVRKLTVETRDELTAQERQVALFARDGMSNIEIGARLFLSQHTVAYHLCKVFSKLGINSRRELAAALPRSESELVPV